ncbi:hypothetical protein BDN72DRAFT_906085 [Pluteus cervinus]|uniref:Uncharacterized protein n=1 Tax=Pluteus cervinus TaxID=181527 RepID=A0ACD3A0L0_9AGAR|nr:hypothetical protein BDN72DRAFT_906085 [Pluteus cervinus]
MDSVLSVPNQFHGLDSINDDILLAFLEHFTPGDLMRFSRLNHNYHTFIAQYVASAFSVPRHLERFFPGAIYSDFRSLQARTGAVVFGATALNVFTRTYDDKCVLDVMVTLQQYGELSVWLQLRGFRYHEEDREDVDDDEDVDVSSYYDDDSEYEDTPRPADIGKFSNGVYTIHVWIARHTTLEKVIGSNLTCTMNFITANDAISLYPHSSFHLGQVVRIRDANPAASEDFVNKYRRSGWSIIDNVPGVDRAYPRDDFYADIEDETGIRCVGDGKCWIIPCVPNSRLTEHSVVRFIHSWNLEFTNEGAYSRFIVLRSEELRERYIVSRNTTLRNVVRGLIHNPRDQYVQFQLERYFESLHRQ